MYTTRFFSTRTKARASALLLALLLCLSLAGCANSQTAPGATIPVQIDKASATVSYLGPEGTYTQEACGVFFEKQGSYLPYTTVQEAVQALVEGQTSYAVIPQENTIGGAVIDYVDTLIAQTKVSVVGEVELPISQNLLALPEGERAYEPLCELTVQVRTPEHPRFITPHQALWFERRNMQGYEPSEGVSDYRRSLSTDEGIAFLVDADGARIYHAGDLNDWHWDDIDLPWNEEQRTGYSASLSAIAEVVEQDGRIPDAAFVPVDSRLGEFFWMGMDGYMQKVGARYLFPMHLFGDSKVIARLKAHPCAASYADRILGTGTEGEQFEITEGETE